eukprot:Plantae.Rhodophyta-Purpureofilum_apyrenoidigerum.ctg18826.p1 GENE.Plantae.Rhodophyta-Purpureofilum_apyrenoidigerum.ctg18826~~Plantae.Rhodophyta-Purpureofilum_apyrenoidigerum.ctg18826.p1  ORF type:complete len:332 (-),score=70.45 Plantae.Rhodophyta-Purpureofilum_apyrenoidigerum.ctg18826:86-1081(-)
MAAFVGAGMAGVKRGRADRSTRSEKSTVVMATKTYRQFTFKTRSEDNYKQMFPEQQEALPVSEEDKPFVFDPTSAVDEIDNRKFEAPKARISPLDFMLNVRDSSKAREWFKPGPKVSDVYMADKITKQYKAMTMQGGGIYSTQCTEGTTKGAAELARIRVKSAEFRMKQLSVQEKERMKYENRKQAIINAHGCHHEEKMFIKNPISAATYNVKKSEAMMTCNRYATAESLAEDYMARSVENQMKAKAVPNGVYTVKCSDGAWKDHAESSRVAARASFFRAAQMNESARERAKYNSRKHAITNYGHGCDHEEAEFLEFPAMAAAMRGPEYGR